MDIMEFPIETSSHSVAQTLGSTAGTTTPIGGGAGSPTSSETKASQSTETTETTRSKTFIINPDYKPSSTIQTTADSKLAEYLDAKLRAEQADRRKQDIIDKITLAKTKLALHKNLVSERRAAMNIYAESGGTVAVYIEVGKFAKRGHTLGEIEI